MKLLRDKGLFRSDKRYAGNLKELTSKNRFLSDDKDALIECAAEICNMLLEYYTGQQRAIEMLFPCDVDGIVEDVKVVARLQEQEMEEWNTTERASVLSINVDYSLLNNQR